jgi:hypothetical protein
MTFLGAEELVPNWSMTQFIPTKPKEGFLGQLLVRKFLALWRKLVEKTLSWSVFDAVVNSGVVTATLPI